MLLHRRGDAIRVAMDRAGMSGPDLAAATRRVDPNGKGVSPAVIGFLAGSGKSARDRCRIGTAWLIATALDLPLQSLFSMPSTSTSTEER